MRKILNAEICKEKPNSAALGAFNSAVNTVVGNTENYYILNRDKRGADLITQLEKGITKGFDNKVNQKAANIALKKIKEDYKSYSEKMKSFKENKKNRNKVKKSLKGLDKGLQNAILRSI